MCIRDRRSGALVPARTAALTATSRGFTSARTAATSTATSSFALSAVSTQSRSSAASDVYKRQSVDSRVASRRYQRSSWSGRMARKDANMSGAMGGDDRQSAPRNVWVTRWPAPKQSNALQPGNPLSRRRVWIPQRKSSRRFGQGSPGALSIAKSADAANAVATQHSAAHREQSARSGSGAGPSGVTVSGTRDLTDPELDDAPDQVGGQRFGEWELDGALAPLVGRQLVGKGLHSRRRRVEPDVARESREMHQVAAAQVEGGDRVADRLGCGGSAGPDELTHLRQHLPGLLRELRDVLVLSLIHISEPTRLGMISYAVFCLKKKN